MKKDQVTFAVTAITNGRPVYGFDLLLSVALEGDVQRLTVWRKREGAFFPSLSFTWSPGELTSEKADMISAYCGDSVYNFLLNTFGIQAQLEALP